MARFLKIGLITLTVLLLLAVAAVVAVTQLVDPNDFKPQITEAAREQGNVDLRIEGDLGWTFWPSLGVSIGRTEVRPVGDDALLAAIDSAAVSVAVLPLLWGEVQMDGVTLAGLDADLVEDANGGNWESLGPASSDDAPQPEAAAAGNEPTGDELAIPVSIPSVSITDSRLRYRNTVDGTDIVVDQISLNATDVTLDAPFPVRAGLRYQDQADMRVVLDLDTVVSLNLDQSIYRLAPLDMTVELAGVTSKPIPVRVQGAVEAALDDDRASVRDLVLEVANMVARGSVEVSQLSARPLIAGALKTDSFDANALLEAIGETPIETARQDALSRISLEATLSGPENSAMIDPLVVRIDDSTVKGRAGVTDLDTTALSFDLSLDAITLDDYLPAESDSEEAMPAGVASNNESPEALLPPLSTEPLLPLDALRELSLDGVFKAGSISYDGITLSNLAMTSTASGGLLELSSFSAEGLEGDMRVSARLDARTDTPVITSKQTISGMQVQPLVQMAMDDDLFTGILDLDGTIEARGNSEKALFDSTVGTLDISLARGTVRGVNLHNTLVGGINDMLGTYKALSTLIPGQESGKLPAALSRDTEVVQLDARARLEDKVANIDNLNAELSDGTITGKGFLALRSEQFDLKLGMKSPRLTDNPYLKDQTWPLRCKGNLQGDAADWCRHDKDGFKAIGKSVAARLATDKIKDKYGIEGEGDTAEEVVKDAAEKKAREEVNKKLEEGLQKLFK
jgi:AsmA protein